jgi:hypothetical protein
MARPQLISGARILVVINGRLYGRCSGISWNPSAPKKPARAVDSPLVQEYMPTTVEVMGQMTVFRMIGDGGLEGAGIVAQQIDTSREKYCTIQLIERETDSTVLQINQATVHNQSWNATPKGLLVGSFTFSGIIFTNESSV